MKSVFLILAAMCVVNLWAAPHSEVLLKNGSVLRGDIISQTPGKSMTVQTREATLVLKPAEIHKKRVRKVKYEDLPREMKRWVLENKALKGDAYGRYAELVDIKTARNSYTSLIAKGGKDTYALVSPSPVTVAWTDLVRLDNLRQPTGRYEPADKLITTDGKTHSGKIISQKPGSGVTIDTGKARITVAGSDIKSLHKTGPNGTSLDVNRLDYTNVIVLNDNTEKEGVITAYNYGKKGKDNYIMLLDKSGKPETVLTANVAAFRTVYDEVKEKPYRDDAVYVNEFRIDRASIEKGPKRVVFIGKKVFPFPEGISTVFKCTGDGLGGEWTLVALSEQPATDGTPSQGYLIDQKSSNTVPVNSKEVVDGLTQITYGYLAPGYYALTDNTDRVAYVFKVVKAK